ncbi:MAG: BMC domain-containing protein [Clostridiales bacterium]|jgi:microcompartment protein CcmL/EutN|nr:BMC domain-containing protein [Clostridiales bacterium]
MAYGFFEVPGIVAAVHALDTMTKTANVTLATWERKLGGRLVTLVVEGSVSAVTESIEAARANALKAPAATAVIASPHPETVRLVRLSAARMQKAEAAAAAPAADVKAPRAQGRSKKQK